jgi:hypothetical protein
MEYGEYGEDDSAHYSRPRGGYYNPGYPSRGAKGDGGGNRGRQNLGGYDRWGNPY